ncbi:MAG: glycosyltransferase [Flavobacteriaceae bacterium TMED120]|nr:MAG: glycosyltransferase [Flavobacteriaceae bacterium TMED120]
MTGRSTNSPQLSIVIPIYNEREVLPKLLAQLPNKEAWEVLVVDGQSTDGSWDWLQQQKKVTALQSPRGRALQQNRGAKAAQGTHLLFLHVDSVVSDTAWKQLEVALEAGVPLACFRLAFDHSHPLFRLAAYGSRWSHLLFRGGDQGLVVSSDLLAAVGGFDERYTVCEDLDLFGRLMKKEQLKVFSGSITTSSRRFLSQGIGATFFHFRVIHFLHYCGVGPRLLDRYYRYWLLPKSFSKQIVGGENDKVDQSTKNSIDK